MRYLTIFLFLATILSCQKENDLATDENSESVFWAPNILAHNGNRSVTLKIGNPRGIIVDYTSKPATPDYVEVYYGADSSAMKFHKKVEVNTQQVEFNNLTNNKPYYFYIKTYKGTKSIKSDTVRTIPSTPVEITELFPGVAELERPMVSHDHKFIAYNQNSVFTIKDRTTNAFVKSENANYGAEWAHHSNKMIYLSTITEDIFMYTDKIKLFDAGKNTDELLLDIDHKLYRPGGSALSYDDKKLYLNTSEGKTDKYFMDLWMIDLETKMKTKVGDFGAKQFYPTGAISAGADGKSILLEGGYNLPPSWMGKRYIYRYNLETKMLQLAIKSSGFMVFFSESPDGKHIAFISEYSGRQELWLLNKTDQTLKQLTSQNGNDFDSRTANFKWIDNQSLSVFLYTTAGLKFFKIKVSTSE
jgi:hypothetical protein